MKERPILFSGPMVRAILDGRKTQTRRPVKFSWSGTAGALMRQSMFDPAYKCPIGQPGDRLWVRETWTQNTSGVVWYRADGHPIADGLWRPSIHMPRLASRITLEITRVWVERVHDITDQNAFNEGAPLTTGCLDDPCVMSFRQGFHDLWQSIYGTWDANPWVWAVEFRRTK